MIPRLYVETPLNGGAEIALGPARSHYLRDVLRREAGASVLLFNGRDGEWQGSIARIAKAGASIAVEHRTRAQQMPPDLWLAFAPIMRDPSLTLSGNCLLLPPSAWGRACFAPIPRHSWRLPAGRRYSATAGNARRHAEAFCARARGAG